MSETKVRLQLMTQSASGYEILFMHEGEANGWTFERSVLEESVALWENCQVFVDHSMWGRSVRDLGGVLHRVAWSDEHHGLTAELVPGGPSKEIVFEAARVMLADGPKPDLGFSADVIFTSDGQNRVAKILQPLSVDLVIDPAFATKFIRQLNQRRETMTEPTTVSTAPAPASAPTPAAGTEEVLRELMQAQQKIRDDQAKSEQVHIQMCQDLLASSLKMADLPLAAEKDVRERFEGRAFEPKELKDAIGAWKSALEEATNSASLIVGPRVTQMFSSEDQIQAAVDDLLEAPRNKGAEGLNPHRLTSVRQLYTAMTGDIEFMGGYYRHRVQYAVSTDLPNLLANAMNKIVVSRTQQLEKAGYGWWKKVVDVRKRDNLHDVTGLLVGNVTLLPEVPEGNDYTELEPKDSKEVGVFKKYGGYMGITLEMFDKDDVDALRVWPKLLADSTMRRISYLVASIFKSNPNMADGSPIFHASRNNLGVAALSSSTWEAASQAIYQQSALVAAGGDGGVLATDARYLLVPRALRLTAQRILYPSWEREANIVSENLQRGEAGDVITVPEFTDQNDWAAMADPLLWPSIVLAHRHGLTPQIYVADGELTHAMFLNDEARVKARMFATVFAADYRPLYKSVVP